MLGSEQDPTWRNFPQALTETQGAQRYVTLFEAPFQASVLSEHESTALWVSSLMAIPPLPPRTTPLAGLTTVDLLGSSLTQWALHIQDVTSGMILPPEAAVNCPQADIVGVLNCLEDLTPMASSTETMASSSVGGVPPLRHLPPGLPPADPATMSYATMASLPEAVAGSSARGVPPLRHPAPGPPPGNQAPINTLPALTTEDLLATAGVGRGGRGKRSTATRPRTPTAPGPRQT